MNEKIMKDLLESTNWGADCPPMATVARNKKTIICLLNFIFLFSLTFFFTFLLVDAL